jgi:hypothetical protein
MKKFHLEKGINMLHWKSLGSDHKSLIFVRQIGGNWWKFDMYNKRNIKSEDSIYSNQCKCKVEGEI